jgi:hypothetical protein
MPRILDLRHARFGHLEVVAEVARHPKRGRQWMCRCTCGGHRVFLTSALRSDRYTHCGCRRRTGQRDAKRTGVGDLRASVFNRIHRHAARRGFSFEITLDDAWALFRSQEGRCALTGWTLTFAESNRTSRATGNASLDRIDSSRGYVLGNVQWVHKHINISKLHHDQEYFITLCRAVAAHHPTPP